MDGVQRHQSKGITVRHIHKSTAVAIAGFGVLALLATPSLAAGDHSPAKAAAPVQFAHMGQGQGAQRMGQPCPMGMMGQDMMGQGMMGQGMMVPGQDGQGMMTGPGHRGQGKMGPGLGARVVPSKHLTNEDVRHSLEHRLEMHGNKRLKVGEVKEADDDSIVADITTADGSLVERIEVDRHTGKMRHVE